MDGAATDVMASEILAGNRRALARAITLVESTRPDHRVMAAKLLARLVPHAQRALRIGVTGPPGAGKSTLIDALGAHVVKLGKRVAVLAVDPSSARSGGSILGDKTRMPRLSADVRAFVRPSASGGILGGVARRTAETILLCEAAGFEVVWVETVGVGQSEMAVAEMVDVVVLLALTGAGDELQAIKRGILEVADLVFVTKADGENVHAANDARAGIEAALRLCSGGPGQLSAEVLVVSAATTHGISEAWDALCRRGGRLAQAGEGAVRRARHQRDSMMRIVGEELLARILARPDVASECEALLASVERFEVTAYDAATRLLARAWQS